MVFGGGEQLTTRPEMLRNALKIMGPWINSLVCRVASTLHTSLPHRITSTKCRKNTVVSPDDGPIVARNILRLINILRINCAPSWFYLQDYTEMHGQQNVKNRIDNVFLMYE